MDKIKNLNEILKNLQEKNYTKFSLILRDYDELTEKIILFIYNKDFSKNNIRKFVGRKD